MGKFIEQETHAARCLRKKHRTEAQRGAKRLRVALGNTLKWSDSNVRSIRYISALLVDLSNGHYTVEEITDEVRKFETLLTNQRDQLSEMAHTGD